MFDVAAAASEGGPRGSGGDEEEQEDSGRRTGGDTTCAPACSGHGTRSGIRWMARRPSLHRRRPARRDPPSRLVGAITGEAGCPHARSARFRSRIDSSLVEVPDDLADDIIAAMQSSFLFAVRR